MDDIAGPGVDATFIVEAFAAKEQFVTVVSDIFDYPAGNGFRVDGVPAVAGYPHNYIKKMTIALLTIKRF